MGVAPVRAAHQLVGTRRRADSGSFGSPRATPEGPVANPCFHKRNRPFKYHSWFGHETASTSLIGNMSPLHLLCCDRQGVDHCPPWQSRSIMALFPCDRADVRWDPMDPRLPCYVRSKRKPRGCAIHVTHRKYVPVDDKS